jgi:CO/xanthine dehydrogenase FAD-binding subunit
MRSPLSTLEVVRPRDLAHALSTLHEAGDRARCVPMAGGTDLFVYLNAGAQAGTRFLDLWGLAELRGIRVLADRAVLGALTTFRDIRTHAGLQKRLPALVAAAREIGAWQIQNRATIAGNIANASPAGDSLPVLLAHDAVVHVRSTRGERAIAFGALYRGYRDLALEADELITSVSVPFAPPRATAFFRKVGTRRAQSISKVVFAGVLRVGRDGRVDHARLALGSVAPVTLRARHAEALLMGAAPTRGLAARARVALERDIAPIDDVRSDREYRLVVAGNVLEQFLRTAHAGFAAD